MTDPVLSAARASVEARAALRLLIDEHAAAVARNGQLSKRQHDAADAAEHGLDLARANLERAIRTAVPGLSELAIRIAADAAEQAAEAGA